MQSAEQERRKCNSGISELRHLNIIIREGKVKMKLCICLTKNRTMNMYWGVEVELHEFLTLALDEVRCQLHAPAAFPSG
jgi:hypothetical protein